MKFIFFSSERRPLEQLIALQFNYLARFEEKLHFNSCPELSHWLLQYRSHRSHTVFEHTIHP